MCQRPAEEEIRAGAFGMDPTGEIRAGAFGMDPRVFGMDPTGEQYDKSPRVSLP